MMIQEIPQYGEGEDEDENIDLPRPIGLQRIVCYGDYGFYLVGAGTAAPSASSSTRVTPNKVYTPQMYKFNVSTRRWSKLAPVAASLTDQLTSFHNVPAHRHHTTSTAQSMDDTAPPLVLASRCAAFLDHKRLLIAGGRLISRSFDIPSNSTYVYDLESQTTTTIVRQADPPDPDPNSISGGLPISGYRDLYDQKLLKWRQNKFVLCSRVLDENTGNKRFLFHLLMTDTAATTMEWRDISPVDDPHQSSSTESPSYCSDLCELAIYDDYVYCIDKNDVENCLDVQWRYDLRSRRWQSVQSKPDDADYGPKSASSRPASSIMDVGDGKPADRMFTSCVTYGDCAYIVGGSSMAWAGPSSKKSTPVCSDIWRLHLPTLRWTLMPARLPEGVWFHSADVSASSSNGSMYIFGGFTDVAGRKASSKLWRIYLDAPPTLSCLSWECVLSASNRKKIEEKSNHELRDMRVPLCFAWSLKW